MAPTNKDELIQQFCAFTSAQPSQAETILESHNWQVEAAVATWFASQDGGEQDIRDAQDADSDDEAEVEDAPAPPVPSASGGSGAGGGRTLGGEGVASRFVPGPSNVPATSGGGSRRGGAAGGARGGAGGGMRTLRDLQGDSHAGHGHDDDDDEDQDMFAGGEKSGLAVQNPNSGNPRDEVERMLNRARRNMPRPPRDDDEEDDSDATTKPPTRFTGRGVTLGGEGAESRVIADPSPSAPSSTRPARVQRILHLWSDGFSVDDGPLFRYDDPANAATLAMINQGRAPLELLNVAQNQEVDLQLDNQKDSKFVQPKKKYRPFEGQGQRLGSPTPGVASSTTTSTSVPSAAIPAASSSSSSAAPAQAPALDASQPAVAIQIRLGDGTQLRSRFNTSSTVGDLYDFVTANSPGQRAFVLMTTFPSKELSDKAAPLEETELKKGGVVVQKWT